ncbi:hypothetical protein ABZW32_06520 [Streptomyces sp. NPDC004667]|uniref:hypothetical protein n=1 Tax=Streptomyces sp. NPDC004667 TaxID=3154285 RepID=UPI0033A054CC
MRTRHVVGAVAVAALAVLGTSACSAGSQAGSKAGPSPSAPSSAVPSASASPRDRLRDGLLTQARLPQGFRLLTEEVNSTTTGAPHAPAATVPIASMPCSELGVDSFMTAHARPLEDVAVGLEQVPDDDGWFGQEALDRYAPGRAAEVMADIRGAAQRCPSYATALGSGTTTQETVSVTGADVPADDGLVLRISSTLPDDPDPYVSERAFVREGDVILMVQKTIAQKPRSGVEAVLPAAVAAYRAATAS